jgi:hypothetical protein
MGRNLEEAYENWRKQAAESEKYKIYIIIEILFSIMNKKISNNIED